MGTTHLSGPLSLAIPGVEIQVAQRLVTSAELLDLVANPVELIPAPGVGKVLVIFDIIEDYKFGTVAYVDAAGSYGFTRGTQVAGGFAILFTATESKFALDTDVADLLGAVQDRTAIENGALTFVNIGGTDLTDGDGTLTITVIYATVELTA